jgi:hypothetical protein
MFFSRSARRAGADFFIWEGATQALKAVYLNEGLPLNVRMRAALLVATNDFTMAYSPPDRSERDASKH